MKGPLRSLPALPVLFLLYSLPSETNLTADANALKLLISVETQTITAPFPARVTLEVGRLSLHVHFDGEIRLQ